MKPSMALRLWCEYAWLGGRSATEGVLLDIHGERIESVEPGVTQPPQDAVVLHGVTLPGFVNVHINSLDRPGRGAPKPTAHDIRQATDSVADLVDIDRMATAVMAEQSLAGYTTVGHAVELRRQPDGSPFATPGALHDVLIAAAQQAGVRIALIDICSLAGHPRSTHTAVHEWVDRVDPWFDAQRPSSRMRLIGGIADQRGLGPRGLSDVALWSGQCGLTVHARLEEPTDGHVRALDALIAAGVTANRGGFTAIGTTGTTAASLQALGHQRGFLTMFAADNSPTFDVQALRTAGGRVVLAQPAAMAPNPFAAMRAFARCAAATGSPLAAPELLRSITSDAASSLGWRDTGLLASGQLADLVTVNVAGTRFAGCYGDDVLDQVVQLAEPNDITQVAVGGELIVDRGRHRVGDVGQHLRAATASLLSKFESSGVTA
jgi:cytosine/adenosine deaminase-related metal-dependent hydrolase